MERGGGRVGQSTRRRWCRPPLGSLGLARGRLTLMPALGYACPVLPRSVLLCALSGAGCYSGLDAEERAPGSEGGAGAGSTAGDPPWPGDTQGPDATGSQGPVSASQGSATEAGATEMSAETGPLDTGGSSSSAGETTSEAVMTTDVSTTEAATSGTATTDPSGEPPPNEQELLCERWNADRADLSEGSWDGAVNGCNAGALGEAGHANALRLINLYRWIADLPPVGEDGGRSEKAQACALMMDANDALSHDPPANWKCYTAGGKEAAGNSNIAGAPGVAGIDLYMVDYGNETTIGHRRWILSNSLGPVGIGSTSQMSCLYVIGGSGAAGAPWTAWPPPGLVPYQAMHVPTVPWSNVDEAGWTVQSDGIDVGKAQVTVTENGVDKPVKVNALGMYFGAQYAVRFVPQGWQVAIGSTYEVKLSVGIEYSVTIVDCE